MVEEEQVQQQYWKMEKKSEIVIPSQSLSVSKWCYLQLPKQVKEESNDIYSLLHIHRASLKLLLQKKCPGKTEPEVDNCVADIFHGHYIHTTSPSLSFSGLSAAASATSSSSSSSMKSSDHPTVLWIVIPELAAAEKSAGGEDRTTALEDMNDDGIIICVQVV
jgi:hypothetical protein